MFIFTSKENLENKEFLKQLKELHQLDMKLYQTREKIFEKYSNCLNFRDFQSFLRTNIKVNGRWLI
ncbi:MAG: hypothetical protein ACFFAO_06425 [Candidatus Hermodarchaeota archaeon]